MPGSLKLLTESGGSLTIAPTDTGSSYTMSLPSSSDTITTNTATQILSNKTLTNPIIDGKLGVGTTSPQFLVSVNQNSVTGSPSVRQTPQFYAKGYAGASAYHAGIGFAMYEHTNGYWGSGILSHDDTSSYGSALAFYTSTGSATPSPTERMRIDSFGRVTKPYQPAFSAYSTNGTNVSGANVKLNIYGGTELNTGNHYNTTNSRFTAPLAGVYIFKAMAWLPPSTTLAALSIRVNGSQRAVHRMSHTGTQSQYCTLTPVLIYYLNVNDYVELYTSVDGGTLHPSAGEQYSNFSGYLLG